MYICIGITVYQASIGLTIDVGKGAEYAAGTVAGLLDVVALGRLVDLRVELLLGARVTVDAVVALVAVARLAPFLAVLHVRAWCRTALQDALY